MNNWASEVVFKISKLRWDEKIDYNTCQDRSDTLTLSASPPVSLPNFKTYLVHSGYSWYCCKQENSFLACVGRVVMVHDLMFGLFVSAWVTQPQLHSMETQEGPSGPVFVSLPPQNVANWPPPWVRDTLSHPPPFRSHLLWKGQEITVWGDRT